MNTEFGHSENVRRRNLRHVVDVVLYAVALLIIAYALGWSFLTGIDKQVEIDTRRAQMDCATFQDCPIGRFAERQK